MVLAQFDGDDDVSKETGVQPQVESFQRFQKTVLGASLLNMQHYKVQIKGKWRNPGKEIAPSSTPQCSSYWKRSLRVALFTYL